MGTDEKSTRINYNTSTSNKKKKSNFQTLQESEKKPAPPIIIWVWLMNAIKQSLSTPFKKLIYLKNKIF
jgi:hypothetical protein